MESEYPGQDENERAAAFAWLMASPDDRALELPTRLDALLCLYAAREQFPASPFSGYQFIAKDQRFVDQDHARYVRYLPWHGYTF